MFIFTSHHFAMVADSDILLSKHLLESNRLELFAEESYMGRFRYEPRFGQPVHGPAKNVMSGNTAFTKSTFLKLGGVDPWYRGHGAFADSDFHMQAAQAGCGFLDLGVVEIHCQHAKLDEAGAKLEAQQLRLLGLDNFLYYCRKWQLPLSLAESLAFGCGIENARTYVRNRLKHLEADPDFHRCGES